MKYYYWGQADVFFRIDEEDTCFTWDQNDWFRNGYTYGSSMLEALSNKLLLVPSKKIKLMGMVL